MVVSSKDEKIQKLEIDRRYTIDAISGIPRYCRIALIGIESPLVFSTELSLEFNRSKPDIAFYLSLNKEEYPTAAKSERIKRNKKKFFFAAPDKKSFFDETDVLFIGIESQIGCSIELVISVSRRDNTSTNTSLVPAGGGRFFNKCDRPGYLIVDGVEKSMHEVEAQYENILHKYNQQEMGRRNYRLNFIRHNFEEALQYKH